MSRVLRLSPQFFAEDTTPAEMGGAPQDDGSSLFDADTMEDTMPSEDSEEEDVEIQQETDGEAETPPQNPAGEMTVIKHNHRETQVPKAALEATAAALGIPPDAVVATLQKGMNYEAALARAGQTSPEAQILERYAAMNGMNRAQYIAALEKQYQENLVQSEVQRVQGTYPDADPVLARQVAEGNLLRRQAQEQQEAQRRQQEEREQREAPWADLFAQNPALTAAEIPEAVFQKVADGMPPLAAWYQYQNEELQRQIAAGQQNQKNQKSALGSVQDGTAAKPLDPFLAGFDSVFH